MEKNITVDITAPERYLLKTTRRVGMASYKSAQARFDHRSLVQGIQFPTTFVLTPEELTREFFQFFTSDGTQSVTLTGQASADFPNDPWPEAPEVLVDIEYELADENEGSRWWNGETSEWVDQPYTNRIPMIDGELGEEFVNFFATLNIQTGDFPDIPGAGLRIIFYMARSTDDPPIIPDETVYTDLALGINNPMVEEGRNTAIDYRLTQQTDAKGRYNDGAIWFGDGPTLFARSAITRDEAGAELTSAWKYPGESGDPLVHAHISLREVMDMKRTLVRGLVTDLLGKYKPCQVPNIDGYFHFFIGGNQNGKQNLWQANLFRINRTLGTPQDPEDEPDAPSAITGTEILQF